MRTYEAHRRCNGKTLMELSEETGIKYDTLQNRWYHGDRTYERLTRPVKYNHFDVNHLDCCTDKGKRLLKAIADSGMSINQVCKICGVSNSTVTKFAHDDSRITAILLAKLCATVGVSMDYVMGLRRER